MLGEGFASIVASVVMEEVEEEEEGLGAMLRHVQLRTMFMSSVEACVTLLSRVELKF